MLIVVALALASQQVGVRPLVYRPELGITSVYWFTATLEQTEGPPHPTMGEVSVNISTVEIRTVVDQSPHKTTLKVETFERLLSATIGNKGFTSLIDLEVRDWPIVSLITLDAQGVLVAAEGLKNPEHPYNVHKSAPMDFFLISEGAIVAPFPVGLFRDKIRWTVDVTQVSPYFGMLAGFGSYAGAFVIECMGTIVPQKDELSVLIKIPEQHLGISVLTGSGSALIRLSTGEVEFLEMAFEQRVRHMHPQEAVYLYRYTAQRIAEYATPAVDGL